jgi:hypothetical protein
VVVLETVVVVVLTVLELPVPNVALKFGPVVFVVFVVFVVTLV